MFSAHGSKRIRPHRPLAQRTFEEDIMSDDIQSGDLVRCFRESWDRIEEKTKYNIKPPVNLAGSLGHLDQTHSLSTFSDDELFYGIAIRPGECGCCRECRVTGWYVLSKQWGMQLYDCYNPDSKDAWLWTITPVKHEDER